jgi:hypothetical protein
LVALCNHCLMRGVNWSFYRLSQGKRVGRFVKHLARFLVI